MKLIRLQAHSFRNVADTDLSFGCKFNIFHGKNAQGKTNLLEAVFLLGTMKSFRLAKNIDLINWNGESSILRGWVEKEGVTREISLLLERQGKKILLDGKGVTRLSDFFGNLNVVVFSPEDLAMVKGMPDSRRRYLDRAVFSSDLGYLQLFHEYGKIVKSRNVLLKKGDTDCLDIWDQQLAKSAASVVRRRLDYLSAINPIVEAFYREISGNGEEARIVYNPHLVDRNRLKEGETLYRESLSLHAAEERRRGITMIGPHRDDLEFMLDGKMLKHYGSQGQQRTFILALKMAEIEYLQQRHGHPPVLLLDDMTSELDEHRNRNLMEFLEKKEMQVFITTTSMQNIRLDDLEKYPAFRIEAGKAASERQ